MPEQPSRPEKTGRLILESSYETGRPKICRTERQALPHQHPGTATHQAVGLQHGPKPRQRGPDLRNDDQRRGQPRRIQGHVRPQPQHRRSHGVLVHIQRRMDHHRNGRGRARHRGGEHHAAPHHRRTAGPDRNGHDVSRRDRTQSIGHQPDQPGCGSVPDGDAGSGRNYSGSGCHRRATSPGRSRPRNDPLLPVLTTQRDSQNTRVNTNQEGLDIA